MYSGRFAAINGYGNIVSWNLTESIGEDKFVNSATKGGTDRVDTIKDVSGSWAGIGGLPAVLPGDGFTFVGYTSPTSGVYNTAGMRYTADVICSQVQVVWDFAQNKIIRHSVQFQGNGALTVASGAAVVDGAVIPKYRSNAATMVYGAVPTALLDTVRQQATLTITSALSQRPFNGIMYREAGPIDWMLDVGIYGHNKELAVGLVLDDLKLSINAVPDVWHFKHGRVMQSTDIKLNPETGGIDTQTIKIAMQASSDAGALGFIKKPGVTGSNWWPLP